METLTKSREIINKVIDMWEKYVDDFSEDAIVEFYKETKKTYTAAKIIIELNEEDK